MDKKNTHHFIASYAHAVLASGLSAKTSFTMEMAKTPPIVEGLTIPLAMGFTTHRCVFVTQGWKTQKFYLGHFLYDASAGGYRVQFDGSYRKFLEDIGAGENEMLEFHRGESLGGALYVSVTKHVAEEEEAESEITSPSLRGLTLAAARRLVQDSTFTLHDLESLLVFMDHEEATVFLRHVLMLLAESHLRAAHIQAIMQAVVTTAPTVHMGFAALCAICFQIEFQLITYKHLDYILYIVGMTYIHQIQSFPEVLPLCQQRTFRRFPMMAVMLFTIELKKVDLMQSRGHTILQILCNMNVQHKGDEVLLQHLTVLCGKNPMFRQRLQHLTTTVKMRLLCF